MAGGSSFFLLASSLVPNFSSGQNAFQEKVNVAFFTGGFVRQQNTNNNGYWYGIYTDYVPLKSPNGWAGGIFGLVSIYRFQDNDLENIYQGHGREIAGGLSFGKYSEYFSLRHSAFLGCNLGIRQSWDYGNGQNAYGKSEVLQKDLMFSVNLNFNLLKNNGMHPRIFPRTQIMINYQRPIESSASATWNSKPVEDQGVWQKGFQEIIIKESICDIGINRGRDLFLEPKVLVSYRYENGNKNSYLVTGQEISLRKEGRDDFLAIFFTQKLGLKEQNFLGKPGRSLHFMMGLNFCPFNIKNY